MKTWLLLLCGALMALGASGAHGQESCVTATKSSMPTFFGQLTFTVAGANVYYLDLQSPDPPAPPSLVPLGAGVTGPTNPVFTPDGLGIVFAAQDANRHDIFYWQIGSSAAATNLTSATGSVNEDAKFSRDGATMVWKQDGNIVDATFAVSNATPTLGATTPVLTGAPLGDPGEASGPSFSPSDALIYYFTGSKAAPPQLVKVFNVASKQSTEPFTESPNNYYYYSLVSPTSSRLFYVSGGTADKIFTYANADAVSGAASEFNAADANSDNSDPTGIDDDLFIFSRDHNSDGNSAYELYLGRASTNECWSLSAWVKFQGDVVGATYGPTAATAWSLTGANYRAGGGAGDDGWRR